MCINKTANQENRRRANKMTRVFFFFFYFCSSSLYRMWNYNCFAFRITDHGIQILPSNGMFSYLVGMPSFLYNVQHMDVTILINAYVRSIGLMIMHFYHDKFSITDHIQYIPDAHARFCSHESLHIHDTCKCLIIVTMRKFRSTCSAT